MSLFKTKWVILKISFTDKDIFYDIFTLDYGRLFLKSKKDKIKKSLEIWNIIDFEINVKKENMVNYIKDLKIINNFDYKDKDFETISNYLYLIDFVFKNTPKNVVYKEIYNIFFILNDYKNISWEKILFLILKLNYIFWKIDLYHISDEKLKKILNFVSSNHIQDVIKLKWIDENTKNLILQKYILTK